ncbi:hypothetical protein Pmar_PMAR024315, partial [Perkinsus marinus ATCC 50983]
MPFPASENQSGAANSHADKREQLLEFIKAGSKSTDFGYSVMKSLLKRSFQNAGNAFCVGEMAAKFQGVLGTAEIR